ncbi:COMPASS (complex proteins associated with Set1p) component [Amphichorda felina]
MADGSVQNEPTAQPSAPATATGDVPIDGTPLQTLGTPQKDTVMADAPGDNLASSPAPAVQAPSPAPARTGTPAQGSRAASVHPDSGLSLPAEAPPHGDSTRRYLNTKVTGVLLEGMKQIAKDKYAMGRSSFWYKNADNIEDLPTRYECSESI